MKNRILQLTIFIISLYFNAPFSFGEGTKGIYPIPTCTSVSASFISDKVTAGVLETVAFTNTSAGNVSNKWYVNEILMSTTEHFTHVFPISGDYNVKLEVFDENATCSAMITHVFTVNENVNFCGDLSLPDQNPAECECITKFNMDSTGTVVSETTYRWGDRWGNKYCNLSIAQDCNDNIPFKSSTPVPNPPPPSCQAGYFNLYFIDQTISGTLYSIPQNQREIVCQVFADISELISPANPGVIVNFQIKAMFDNSTSMLANAGSYYETNPLITDAIIHGEVWKAINSGQNDPTLYDGVVNINLAHLFYVGYNNITANQAPNQFDLYGIIQHELMHALGFASLITSYSGSSFYTSNNLFSCFDEHLLDNGNDVISNTGPGLNYSFNSLANNCTSLRFNNQSLQQSPVNSYQNIPSGGTAFYGPSHFDDVCTNNPGQLYLMNPSIAQNQQRRLQQEEVNALCKMGYVVTGNYGTSNLLINGSLNNPNQTAFTACSGTGTGIHLAANDDNYTVPFQYFITTCAVQNPTGSYQINVINNDAAPAGTTVVDLEVLGTGQILTATANGFTFSPTTPGLWQISYRLLHPSGLLSNYAIVSIIVHDCSPFPCANNCSAFIDPNSCNLLCNHEMQKSGFTQPAYCSQCGINSLTGPIGTNGTASPSSPNFFEGWQSFSQTPDWGSGGWWNPTTFNQGKVMGMYSSNWFPNINPNSKPESFGQCVQMNANQSYLFSIYHRRTTNLSPNWQPYVFFVDIVNTNNFPIGYTNNTGVMNQFGTTWPPLNSQNIYSSPSIPALDNTGWKQHVVSFTPAQFENFLFIHGYGPGSGLNYFSVDNIELIEDNFTAGVDQNILCGQSAQLSAPCMELTNLHYEWYALDATGNPITPPIALDANVTVNPNTTTSYRLKRFIANQGNTLNNGYFVENAASLFAEDDITIFVTLPSGGADFTNAIDCGTITFTSQNQNGSHFWDFGDGNTSNQINPVHNFSILGTYTVTHTVTEFGCTATFSQSITINTLSILPTFTTIAPICLGDNLVALPTSSTNTPAITGTWSPALNNTTTTTYIFTPNAGECATTTTMTIIVNLSPTPTIAGPSDICLGQTATLTASGGTSYSWSPGGQTTASISVSPTATTTYTVTATDANGCVGTVNEIVTVNPSPTPTITGPSAICLGQTATLTASGGTSYSWSPGGQTTASITVSPTATTTYTLLATDVNGCVGTVNEIITVNPLPTPTITGASAICLGQTATLTASGGTSYSWSPGGQTTASISVSPTATTTYTLTATDVNGCVGTVNEIITVNPLPTPTITGPSAICLGQTATLTASGGTSYSWSPGGQTTASISVSPTATTTYTVTATNANGCVGTTTQTITVNPLPTPSIAGTSAICLGQTATLTASGGTSYSWSPGGQTTASITVSPNATTTYTVTATNANGCTATATQTITVNPLPTPTIAGASAICLGQTTTLTASGGTSYSWSPGVQTTASISVSPTSTTTYTLTATDANGCVGTVNEIVTVNPLPTPTIAGPSTICQGQTATLTASGGTSYLWSPGGQTTASISVSPTATTTYTVTATNANGCTATATKTLTVNPTPTPTIAGPTAICQGQTTTLTASGGTSYSWSPGGQTTASISVTPSATTTYTVTATNANGCVGTTTKTVTVNAIPTVSVSPTNTTVCSFQSTLLNATGANSYTWTPTGGLSSATGNSVSAMPTTSTTYTVTGTTNGCTATATSTITVQACTDCVVPANTPVVPATITSNANYNGTTVLIPNNVTISANVTFTNCNVKIMPGVTITVSPNVTLTITGSHLYGCENMWQGIVVQAGGKVIIQQYVSGLVTKTTLIEDATIALNFEAIPPSLAMPLSPLLQVNNATFNKNATAINIQGYPFYNVANIFSVKNSLFTCRSIYNTSTGTWAPTTTVKAANNNTNLFLEPYITATYPVANLKFPMAATFSEKGINLLNVGTTTNSSPPVYTSIVFGSTTQSEFNLFDNLKVGIFAENSNFKVINTTFQFPQVITNAMYSTMNLPNIGTGIFAKNTTGSRYKVDVAGTTALPNKFYGLSRAVDVLKYNNVQFVYNTILSNRPSVSLIAGNNNGRHGVYMTMSKYDNVFIDHNTIYNIEKGVYLNALDQGNSPTVRVTYNTIQKDLSTTIGAKMKDTILLENALSTGSNTGGTVWVNNNTISGVYRAITLKTWKRTNIQVNNNGIALVGNNFEFPQCHGINLEQCAAGSLQSQIYNNSITGFNLNYIGSKGINITASTGNELKCNAVNNTYSGLYFNGNCNPTKTFNNSMQNHRYGFTLDNNGIIGQQGTATSPADNRWLGTAWSTTGTVGGNFKNACLNGSFTTFSNMYVRSGAMYNPDLSTTNLLGNQWYQIALPQSLYLVTNPPLYVACSAIATPPANALIVSETTDALVSSTTLASSSTTSMEQKAVIQNQTYRQLDADTALLNTSASLNTYFDSLSASNTSKQLSVEKAIAKDSISLATSLNSAVQTENILEESYKQLYAAMLNYQNGMFNSNDSLVVATLSAGCPTLQGGSVALANALYNAVYHEAELFTPVCPEYLDKSMQQASFDESEKSEFVIYPVPNNGSFDMIGELKKDMHLTIMNMDGKIVHLQKITEETSILSIRTNLSNGTYTVLLTDENEAQLARIKIVVIK